jgi:hypothetical protein
MVILYGESMLRIERDDKLNGDGVSKLKRGVGYGEIKMVGSAEMRKRTNRRERPTAFRLIRVRSRKSEGRKKRT